MKKSIFRYVLAASVSITVVSFLLMVFVAYGYLSDILRDHLREELDLAARGVEMSGGEYLRGFTDKSLRFTWVDAGGTVIFDSKAGAQGMENHLSREEISEALESGSGESVRYSDTLSELRVYSALRLSDGTVLRISGSRKTLTYLMLGFLLPMLLIVAFAFLMSFLLASRIAKRLVRPINDIDPDKPTKYIGKREYSEIEPLLKRMEAQRLQIKADSAELEKTSLIRQEFTANVSHELKTPLHAIAGYAELIESGLASEEDIRPFAGKIRAEAGRMTKLVSDIIELSKLDSGAAGTQREHVDLYRIAENAVDSLEYTASEAGITIKLSGVSAVIEGIPRVLYSIIYNLCDNAVKYNKFGGSVSVNVADLGESAVVSVRDTGIGIPKADIDRIFERFYRVDKSHSGDVGGTGLGLSIVKHGALIHKASVNVESIEGIGSEFTVTFPK